MTSRAPTPSSKLPDSNAIARAGIPEPPPDEIVSFADPELDVLASTFEDSDDAMSGESAGQSNSASAVVATRGGSGRLTSTRIGGRSTRGTTPASPPRGEERGGASGLPLPPETPPEVVDAPAPPYPPDARRFGTEGDVRCRMYVDVCGIVTLVKVLVSSGSPLLDEAARQQLVHWRFKPATQAGRACACEIDHVVTFRLTRATTTGRPSGH